MENNKYTEQQIINAVAHRFKGGKVATVTTNEVVVRIGKSFTRIPLRELKEAVRQSEIAPKEDLTTVARDMISKEREANGVTLAESKTLTKADVESNHRQDIADRYGL